MNDIDLRAVDLNLLKTFDAMAREGSVTRSAERLGLGQSAVSHALNRLREVTRDELFVRGAGGMEPTARARDLIGPIRAALAGIEGALFGLQAFDAARTEQSFNVGITDDVAAAMMPDLARALAEAAPGAVLRLRDVDSANAGAMLDGREIDLALGQFPVHAAWHRQRPLYEEDHVCIHDPNLLDLDTPVSIDDFIRHPHIVVSRGGEEADFIDHILARRGLVRRVALITPYLMLAGELVRRLPMLACLPRRYASACAEGGDVVLGPLPFKTSATQVSMMWRTSDDISPAQAFLRDLALEAAL